MDAGDRARSVKGAFRVTRKRLVEASSILLVDDVFTTGSTVSEACRVLLESGASRVSVLTLGRVASPGDRLDDRKLTRPIDRRRRLVENSRT
jgi:predicted amidophosphoribosyltransferase